eukprot:2687795-Rhodomonas_salina.1
MTAPWISTLCIRRALIDALGRYDDGDFESNVEPHLVREYSGRGRSINILLKAFEKNPERLQKEKEGLIGAVLDVMREGGSVVVTPLVES